MFPITVQSRCHDYDYDYTYVMIMITIMIILYLYWKKFQSKRTCVCISVCVHASVCKETPPDSHTHMSKLLGMFEICIKVIVMINNDYNLEYTHF